MSVLIICILVISLLFGSMGCLIVWNKNSYLGDSVFHSVILSTAISRSLNINLTLATLVLSIIFWILTKYIKDKNYGNTEVLYISSSFLSSIAIIVGGERIFGIFFGDILLASYKDIYILLILTILFISIFIKYRFKLIRLAINRDICSGSNVVENLLNIIIIFTIGISIPIVGGMLVTCLLIVPPIIASNLSKNPIQMMTLSVLIGLLINFIGTGIGYYFDWQICPTITIIGSILLIISRARSFLANISA